MIEVQGLNKTYGQKQVLTNVSFRADNGLVTGFVGPNGAGKSTTMRIIAAIEKPDSGITLVDGEPFSKASTPARTLGAYLGSEYLPNHMTAAEYLAYICKANKLDKASIPALLEMVELSHAANKPISSFSLGMRQRAGLAAALSGNPANLMLDEPVNGLDPMGVQWLRGVIRQQAAAGRAVLLSSHLLSELELVADRVVMLDKGVVVRMGSTNALSNQTGPVRVLVKTSNNSLLANHVRQQGYQVENAGEMMLVTGLAPERLADLAFRLGLQLSHLEVKHTNLEELFMSTASSAESAARIQAPPQATPLPAHRQKQPRHARPQPNQQYPQQEQGVSHGR